MHSGQQQKQNRFEFSVLFNFINIDTHDVDDVLSLHKTETKTAESV